MAMTLEDVKASVAALTEEERLDLQAFMRHLARVNDPEHRRELTEAMGRMDQGRKVYLDEFIRDHATPRVKEGTVKIEVLR